MALSKGMLPSRIVDALNFELRWMTCDEIASYLSEDPNDVHGILFRLSKNGCIERRRRWIGPQRRMGGKPYLWEYKSLEADDGS